MIGKHTRNEVSGQVHAGAKVIQVGELNGDILLECAAYRLQFVTPTPGTENERVPRSHRGPSYLLDARRRIAPFHSRPGHMRRLCEWINDDELMSLLLLHGPGGYGKTRLASQFATSAHEAGWAVAEAGEQPDRLANAPDTRGLDDDQPLLIVVDYADRWARDTLTQLISNTPLDHTGRKVRVLLLARPGSGLWNHIRSQAPRSFDLADPLEMGEFTADRRSAFNEAAVAFAAQLGITPRAFEPPCDLSTPAYRAPLDLHMSALAAVLSSEYDGQTTSDPFDLSRYLLDHERRCWGRDFDVVEQWVLVATLFGPLTDRSAGRALVRAARLADGDADADAILTRHEQLYPPLRSGAGAVGREVLPPLCPDRFGEDFVAECLAESSSRDRVHHLLTSTDLLDGLALRRGLTVLGVTADRHGTAEETLFAALRQTPQLTTHAPSSVVQLVADHGESDLVTCIADALPQLSTELLAPAAAIAQRRVNEIPPDASDHIRAHRLMDLGSRLAELGRRQEALAPTQEAVDLCRRLADANPDAYLANLASALMDLGNRLAELGRQQEALPPTQEAVDIRLRLAEANVGAYLPDLAMALNNVGIRLAGLGRWQEALAPTQVAVDIWHELAEANPDARPELYLPYLAMALSNLGNHLADLGRPQEALAPTQEAVRAYRRLAEANPDAHLPNLAATLNNLSIRLAEEGRRQEALAHSEEAVRAYRRLAVANPDAHLSDLAAMLNNLGCQLADLGRLQEALAPTQEAVDIRRRLAEANPDTPYAFLPGLAMALSNLGNRLADLGRTREALAPTQEAVDIRRRLAEANPDASYAYLADHAGTLKNLAVLLAKLGRSQDALPAINQSIRLFEELARNLPDAFDDRLEGAYRTRAAILALRS